MSDTLTLLGKLADDSAGRDAVHIAVVPVIAAHALRPGEHVGWADETRGTVGRVTPTLGIVDPYLTAGVQSGQRFWLFLFPQTITSLRHVWTHPAFPAEGVSAPARELTPHEQSRRWIELFAADLDQTYNRLMSAAQQWVETDDGKWDGEYTRDDSETYKSHYDRFPEFWKHYEVVTGRKPKLAHCFFTCSC